MINVIGELLGTFLAAALFVGGVYLSLLLLESMGLIQNVLVWG